MFSQDPMEVRHLAASSASYLSPPTILLVQVARPIEMSPVDTLELELLLPSRVLVCS